MAHAARAADDDAAVEEFVGDLHGRVEQAAGVAAQIEHEAEQLVASGGGVRSRAACSRSAAVLSANEDRRTYARPLPRYSLCTVLTWTSVRVNAKCSGASLPGRSTSSVTGVPGVAAHARDRSRDVVGVDGNVVDGRDDVAGQNAGTLGRSAFERRHDRDLAALEVHVEPNARVVARRADADVLVLLGVEERRMLVEVGDDAADRGFDDALVVDAVDVLAPHAVDDLGDERRGLDRRIERGRRGFGSPREGRPDRTSQCQPKPEHDAGE